MALLPAYSCGATTGLLSCDPDYRVRFTGQGGFPTLAMFDTQVVEGAFNRRLDATSDALLRMMVESTEGRLCCDVLADRVQGWKALELEIWRDGALAYAGPVTYSNQEYGQITVKSQDLSVWWRRRRLPAMEFRGVDLADIFASVHAAAMEPDPVANFTVSPVATGIIADRTVLDTDDFYAMKVIEELSRTGVDWTAYGRRMLVGSRDLIEPVPIVTLTDEMWAGTGPRVEFSGDHYASDVILRGAGSLRSRATLDPIPAAGFVTRVFNDETIEDQASLDAAALAYLSITMNPWRVVTPEQGSLACGAPIPFASLIPGAQVRVQTTVMCQPFSADFRLTGVFATFDNPNVQITLSPIGQGGFVDAQGVDDALQ